MMKQMRKLKLDSDHATATVLLLVTLVTATTSFAFEVFSLGWFVWCALGCATIVIFWPEIVEVVRTDEPHANSWPRILAWAIIVAVHIALAFATAAVVDSPSIRWVAVLMSGLYLLWTVVEWTVGKAERKPVYKAIITHRGKPALTELDVERIKTEIERQWADGTRAEIVWPPEFDWDRLERVLAKLEGAKILLLPHDATDHDEAMKDVMENWRRRGATASELHGYVYYLKRDVANITDCHRLRVYFGSFAGDTADRRPIANLIRDAFTSAGFLVTIPPDALDNFDVFPAG
jgi:hypothetical protein